MVLAVCPSWGVPSSVKLISYLYPSEWGPSRPLAVSFSTMAFPSAMRVCSQA